MINHLELIGLYLILIGSTLLFFYGLPVKKKENVLVFGLIAYELSPDLNKDTHKWQKSANKFLKRAKFLNRSGFALVFIGTLLQIISIHLFTQ